MYSKKYWRKISLLDETAKNWFVIIQCIYEMIKIINEMFVYY